MHTQADGVVLASSPALAVENVSDADWRHWCRLCAKEDSQGNISVFFKDEQQVGGGGGGVLGGSLATAMAGGSDMSLAAAIGKYFWVNITRNEELPRMLCTECFSLVTSLVNFSERVTKVQQMFCTLQATPAETALKIDLHALRIKYGLLDEEREHVLMQQTQPEVHYLESKPKINELEEQLFEGDARTAAPNPLEQTQQQYPRIRIKIKKEQILEDSTERPDDCEDDADADDDDDPFNGDYEDADDDLDMDFKPLKAVDDKASSSDGEEDDDDDEEEEYENDDLPEELQADDLLIEPPTTTAKAKRKLPDATLQESPPKKLRRRRTNAADAAEAQSATVASVKEEEEDADASADNLGDFECTVCARRFKRAQYFRQHMKRAHAVLTPAPALPCGQCKRTFTTANQLERHAKVHLPLAEKKVQPCPYCEKKFTSHTLVQSHIKYIHMNERPFICEECGVAVRTIAALKTHMLTHTDYAPFECEVCKKGFKNQIRLRNHMETHDPNKHICAECGLQLNSRATLNRHLLVHSDEMTHKCDYCGRAFKRAKALKNHLILHTGLKPYSCDFCDRTFANGSNCRSHKKKAHPEELAALEATGGGKMYTRNIPKLEALKAVTKAADNLAPVVSKQSGCFAFGKKPKTTPTKDQKKPPSSLKSQKQIAVTATNAAVHLDLNALHPTMSGSVLVSSPPGHGMNAINSAAAASIPTIDNIYNHIMKQATMSAAAAAVTQKRPPSQASSSSCVVVEHESEATAHLQQLHHIHLQQQQQLTQLQQSNISQPPTPGTPAPQQHFYAHLPPDHDSQASSSHMTSTVGGGDEHSNASAHFYNQIRQNLPGPYM